MTFRVGQKVVCVDTSNLSGPWSALRKGGIYTIAKLGFLPGFSNDLMLDVVEGPISTNGWPAFFARRFRPIVKTDISIFTEMLTPKVRERETV